MSLWPGIGGDVAIPLEKENLREPEERRPPAERLDFAADAARVAAARGGDRAAFGWLYERYFRMVHGILLSRVPRTDVRDLVQDVFVCALRKLSSLRDPAAFGGWLARIARNRANDYHRHGMNTMQEEAGDRAPGERTVSPEERNEALTALRAIRDLPDAYRETLILRFVEGMTGPEIAERTGLTAGSVRVNLHRGMKLLRKKLAQGASL